MARRYETVYIFDPALEEPAINERLERFHALLTKDAKGSITNVAHWGKRTLSYPTEFMGCMIGEIHGNAVIVRRIAPADVEPGHSTATRVVPEQTCEDAGWAGTVGMIHSHPDGQRCWYFFPGTRVASSDAHSFARQAYPVDAIMCGNRVVWLSRDMVQQQVGLSDPDDRPAAPPREQRGNRVHAGAAAPEGQD